MPYHLLGASGTEDQHLVGAPGDADRGHLAAAFSMLSLLGYGLGTAPIQ